MELLPGVRADSAGTHLAGPDYVAIAVTATGGTTTDTELDEHAPQGFDVIGHPAGPPAEDSVEAAVAGREPVLLDLRAARGVTGLPGRIRHVTTHLAVDLPVAFDGVVCLPGMMPAELTTPR